MCKTRIVLTIVLTIVLAFHSLTGKIDFVGLYLIPCLFLSKNLKSLIFNLQKMDVLNLFIFIALLVVIALFVWKEFLNQKSNENRENQENQESEKIGELKKELEKERSAKNELAGKGKQMWTQAVGLEKDNRVLQEKLDVTGKELVKLKSERERNERDVTERITKLEHAEKKFDEEKIRVQREDEERRQQEEENRNRVWAEHENTSIAKMKEICQKSDLAFTFHDNTNLPDSFDGSFKPDFLIKFLGQYVIFDAKMSRTGDLQGYLKNNQVAKNTAQKIKNSSNKDEIYPTVFFIVPTIDISSLRHVSFLDIN